ncbi:type IV pilus assembly protein PilV [Oxalobacteraceae bacterium GrIS 2.11]
MSNRPLFYACRRGFTLTSVLISLLILSIGVIAALKMQVAAIQATQQYTYFKSALILASDIADKIRSNFNQSQNININQFLTINFRAEKDKVDAEPMCFDIGCTPDQLVSSDIAEWLSNISKALPNARAVVCRDTEPWSNSKNGFNWECKSSNQYSGVVIKLGWADKESQEFDLPPKVAIPVAAFRD